MSTPPVTIILGQSRRTTPLPKSYSDLINAVKTLYSDSLSYPFKIYYYDLERDLISVTTQDDYNVACTGLPLAKLEFIILHDIKSNKHSLRRYICSFTERARGNFGDRAECVSKTKLIGEAPLEESKVLTDSSFEMVSKFGKEEANKSSKNVIGVKSCCTHELCNISGGINKYLKNQIRDIVRKEMDSAIKREMEKITMISQCTTPKYNNTTDDNGCNFCDRCLVI